MTDTTEEKKPTESLFEMFGTDSQSAEEGKWFKFGEKIEIKIRRYKAKKSRKVREMLEAPYKRSMRSGGVLAESVQEAITNEHIATGIIADWKGVTDIDGNVLVYNKENAKALMEQLPEFRDAVADISVGLNNYIDDDQEDVVGN